MNTSAKRTIFSAVLAIVMVATMAFAPASSVDANAAVYTSNGAKLSIVNGRAIYTSSEGNQTQLTSSLVVADGVIASDGTVYLLYMNGSLYVYSPKYSNGSVTYYTSGVKTISESGYETSAGHKNFLTEEELKNLLGGGTNINGNNTGNKNSSNGNTTKGVSKVGKNIIYTNGTYSYVITDGTDVLQYFESNGKVYLRYTNGDLKVWDSTTKKDPTTVATGTIGFVTSADGKTITGYYDSTGKTHNLTEITANGNNNNQQQTTTLYVTVGPDKKSVTVVTMASSNASAYSVYTLTLADKNATIDWAYPDKDGTVYIRDNSGNLYIWNYQIQKDITSAVVNAKIASSVTTAITANNLLTGYVEGSSMKQAWSLDQVKVAIAKATTNTNNATNSNTTTTITTKPDTSTITLKKVITKNTYKMLYDSNGNEIDQLRLKNKVLYYGDMAFKGVKKVDFTKTGNVVFVKTNGKCYGLNTTTLKTKVLMSKNASYFCHNNNGFAVKIQRKNGTKVKITF